MSLSLSSPAFVSEEHAADTTVQVAESASMPQRFATRAVPGGQNTSVPYVWRGSPEGTRSFALTLVDKAPLARGWLHWMVVDIPAAATFLREDASGSSAMPSGAVELPNSFGYSGYGGPQPPIGTGVHRYGATLYALDVGTLGVPADATLEQVMRAMDGHILASATCTGHFGH